MLKCYFVLINPKAKIDNTKVQTYLGSIGDWLRFSPTSYVITSEKSSIVIRSGIREIIGATDDIIVVMSDLSEYSGWVSTVAVEWLKKSEDAISA